MPQALELRIEVRDVYGKTLMYPANQAATALARIAGSKTLGIDALKQAKLHLGAVITVESRHAALLTALLT